MLKNMKKSTKSNVITLGIVVGFYVLIQILSAAGALTNSFSGQLVPICAYVIMAVSLNLTVGMLGELSLGHAGFMSVGAFSGTLVYVVMSENAPQPLALLLAFVVGGAVAGLAGGVGVALTMMVNGLTLDKKGFENDRERLLDAIAKGNELKERFIDVMNRDSEVFDGLIESLALPKDDDAHKAIRRGAVQASFRSCTQVPLTMMEICSEAIDLCAELVGTTNPNVVSDLGIAALTLKTAMQSAWLNVLINLSSLKDKAFRDECCQKGEALLAHAVPIAQESYEKVIKVITEK